MNDERPMGRGPSPAAVSVPPQGSLFCGELNFVSEGFALLNWALCYVFWTIIPWIPNLSYTMPTLHCIAFFQSFRSKTEPNRRFDTINLLTRFVDVIFVMNWNIILILLAYTSFLSLYSYPELSQPPPLLIFWIESNRKMFDALKLL